MIKSVSIKNFRSIENQKVELTPIVFIYGNNAAGKSSLFYSFNILRNIVSNPNQPIDSFFSLGFANLGSFKKVVTKHDETKTITISIDGLVGKVNFTYGVKINPKRSEFFLHLDKPYSLEFSLPVTFPYPLNLNVENPVTFDDVEYKINWNGVTAQVSSTIATPTDSSNKKIREITFLLNKIAELIRSVDLVSVRRGFFEPQYGAVNITQFPIKEEEVASVLAVDENLDHQVNSYLEQMIGRQFRAKPKLGTSLAELTTIDPEAKINSDVVNDGFGVNQLVFVLAKMLNKSIHTVCLEEPESNLHPGAVRKLPQSFIEIAKKENKQLIITTHSEALIIAMLSAVAKGEVAKEDVSFYLTLRQSDTGITSFEKQEVSEEGEIPGGLKSFMAGELEDIKGFFKSKRGKKNVEKMVDDNTQIAHQDSTENQNTIEKPLEQ
ncbi:MAG: AAA family ATPase [bacterium]